jgi:hypothetical protein
VDTIFGADRGVLYLEASVSTLEDLDASREQGITTATEQFLDSPGGTFNKTIDSCLWQVRDLNTNTRAFATWCQNEAHSVELCIVHYVYKKKNESEAFRQQAAFNDAGEEFQELIAEQNISEYRDWKSKIRNSENYRVSFS